MPRGPEQLYSLAREQIRNENYVRALDTLARISRESPHSPYAAKASLTRLAVLGGLARGSLALGEAYREASKKAEPASDPDALRRAAMDQFTLGQSWALGLVEGLDPWPPVLTGRPLVIDALLPTTPAPDPPALSRLRQRQPLSSADRAALERAAVHRALAEMMAALAGVPGDFGRAYDKLAENNARLEPAAVFLAFGNELVSLSALFGPEALSQPRYARLFHERALVLAARALATAGPGDSPQVRQAERLRQHCLGVLAGPSSPGLTFRPQLRLNSL